MQGGHALVAIVDDEESIRTALLRLFRYSAYQAEAFDSAAAFLKFLHRKRPDCIVLDLHMPETNGLELLQSLSQLDDPPPVIVVTGNDDQQLQGQCMNLGTRIYLQKPVEKDLLLESVRLVMEVPDP